MKCLHICNDFSLTKVHKNLYSNFDAEGMTQIVYNPVRDTTPIGNNTIDFTDKESEIVYSKKIKKYHKVFFRNKMNYLFRDLKKKVELNTVQLVHATTFFTDGALALKVHQEFGTPFIVAVRGTDISVFLRLRPDLRGLAFKIIKKAAKIIFISNSLRTAFAEHRLLASKKNEILEKSVLIYNGIDDFWLDNRNASKRVAPNCILYVGRFIPTKNIQNLIAAIGVLRDEGQDLFLNLVGAGGEEESIIKQKSKENANFVQYMGAVRDKEKLREVYGNNAIFAMPSSAETFGLVYIEALSQGLPILYNEAQGVDGVFPDGSVGEKCDGTDLDSVIAALRKIIVNYHTYGMENINFDQFYWSKIAKKYIQLYEKVL